MENDWCRAAKNWGLILCWFTWVDHKYAGINVVPQLQGNRTTRP